LILILGGPVANSPPTVRRITLPILLIEPATLLLAVGARIGGSILVGKYAVSQTKTPIDCYNFEFAIVWKRSALAFPNEVCS
jgi:hypothetical protein